MQRKHRLLAGAACLSMKNITMIYIVLQCYTPVSGCKKFDESNSDVKKNNIVEIKKDALEGSIASSNFLISYYEKCWTKNINLGNDQEINCRSESIYWSKIDAENGGSAGMSLVANDLMESKKMRGYT
ncbi:MAG: hypothetical protein V4564_15140 [Pseudomonadota bacterium]